MSDKMSFKTLRIYMYRDAVQSKLHVQLYMDTDKWKSMK